MCLSEKFLHNLKTAFNYETIFANTSWGGNSLLFSICDLNRQLTIRIICIFLNSFKFV